MVDTHRFASIAFGSEVSEGVASDTWQKIRKTPIKTAAKRLAIAGTVLATGTAAYKGYAAHKEASTFKAKKKKEAASKIVGGFVGNKAHKAAEWTKSKGAGKKTQLATAAAGGAALGYALHKIPTPAKIMKKYILSKVMSPHVNSK